MSEAGMPQVPTEAAMPPSTQTTETPATLSDLLQQARVVGGQRREEKEAARSAQAQEREEVRKAKIEARNKRREERQAKIQAVKYKIKGGWNRFSEIRKTVGDVLTVGAEAMAEPNFRKTVYEFAGGEMEKVGRMVDAWGERKAGVINDHVTEIALGISEGVRALSGEVGGVRDEMTTRSGEITRKVVDKAVDAGFFAVGVYTLGREAAGYPGRRAREIGQGVVDTARDIRREVGYAVAGAAERGLDSGRKNVERARNWGERLNTSINTQFDRSQEEIRARYRDTLGGWHGVKGGAVRAAGELLYGVAERANQVAMRAYEQGTASRDRSHVCREAANAIRVRAGLVPSVETGGGNN